MKSRRRLLPVFFLFFFLALGVYAVSSTGFGNSVTGFLEQMILPVQGGIFNSIGKSKVPESQLRKENVQLLTQLAELEELKKENKALSDQFKTEKPSSRQLLPAQIIGGNSDVIIINKGSEDSVGVGNILIIKDNLVGRITKVSAHRSVADLLTKNTTSITVKTLKTSALGIGRGMGEGKFVLDNVVLADKLENNDLVVTKGDIDQNGKGYPPNLIVGEIVSVNKKASDLFQRADVEPLIDLSKMEMVFILDLNK